MKMVILVFEKYKVMAGIKKESTPKDLKCSMKRRDNDGEMQLKISDEGKGNKYATCVHCGGKRIHLWRV